ncbi:hypothetical protein [Methanoregula sp.]|jgi:hypothetical protein|uniref:hypothetical protein n=1 Tax=Methanoregula sp. TaxID=2052170 RepID=UPI003C152130
MESLESKLERLSPVQRKEVEDFVDYLIFRSGEPQPAPRMIPQAPPILSQAPPALETSSLSSQPMLVSSPLQMQDPPQVTSSLPAPAVMQESRSTGDDWIARDYIDYGQFEQAPSPATGADKKVKQKISRREEHEKSPHLLDWID